MGTSLDNNVNIQFIINSPTIPKMMLCNKVPLSMETPGQSTQGYPIQSKSPLVLSLQTNEGWTRNVLLNDNIILSIFLTSRITYSIPTI